MPSKPTITPPLHATERDIVRAIGRLLAASSAPFPPGPVPFGDDMASLAAAHADLLWTTDMLMDGVDFDVARHGWHAVGRKAMLVNLSDCAAMAARPISALAAICVPRNTPAGSILELTRGMVEAGSEFHCPLSGGDTNTWNGPAVIAVTVAARTPAGRPPVRRDGAKPGDDIYVSGPLGGSILGRHLNPAPRVELAVTLNEKTELHALIDVSDGLALDLSRVLEASHCGARLDESELSNAIHDDARRLAAQDNVSAIRHTLGDGEDFELIVVVPRNAAATCRAAGLIHVGEITAGDQMLLRRTDGTLEPLPPTGWDHLR